MAFKHHHTEVFLQTMRWLACDQSRQQPRALGPDDLQSARLRQLALGPGGHHGPQAQLLHQPAPRQSDTSRAAARRRAQDTNARNAEPRKAFGLSYAYGGRQHAEQQTLIWP